MVATPCRWSGEKEGVSYDVIQKRRAFASSYSEADLKELFRLMRQYQAPIGPSFIYRMLSIPQTKRSKFQERALKNGWSLRQLNQHIKSRFGARRAGGRKPAVGNEQDFLSALEMISGKLLRQMEANQRPDKQGRPSMAHLKISRKLKSQINRTYEDLAELLEQLTAEV